MNDVPTIAIVDDDASVRRSLVRVVESAGYRAAAFASAREFLAWLADGQAACLVLDVHMDELSGFDLQNRLTVPIVFITGRDDEATLARIESSSAAGHLRKPFDRATVLDTIRRAVGAQLAGSISRVPAVDGQPSSPQGIDGHPPLGVDGYPSAQGVDGHPSPEKEGS